MNLTSAPGLGRVRAAQLLGATVDGVVLSTVVVYASVQLGVPATTVGLVLAGAATTTLVSSVPLGVLADAVGLRRAAIGLSVVASAALVVYALATGTRGLAVGAVLFGVTQAALGAVRQGLAAAAVPASDRIRVRASMHALLNAGLGLGTALGAAVLVIDPARSDWVYALGAVVALVNAVTFVGLPRTRPTTRTGPRWDPAALRDLRFMAATGAAALVQLTMPVLSVLLPAWVVTRTDAPGWTAAVAFGINTVLVLALQTRVATTARDDRSARRLALVAAVALPPAVTLVGAAGSTGRAAAVALILTGTIVLTVGEMAGGAASWHVAFTGVPDDRQGRYQSTFSLSSAAARIMGPAAALPLVLRLGETGWVLLGLVMAAGCLVLTSPGLQPQVTSRPTAP